MGLRKVMSELAHSRLVQRMTPERCKEWYRRLRDAALRALYDPRRFWTRFGQTYMDRFPPKGDRHEALILRELAERGVASLLDVGCGYGRYLRAAARCPDLRLQRVCGVDISPTQVEHARSFLADHPEVELVVSPATRLPLPDLSFDAVLTFGLMIHLRTREVDEFLREARRVCSGWGLFVESSNNLNEPHRNPPYYFAHDYEAVFARHGLGIEKRTPVNLALQEYLYVVRLTGHAGAG